MEKTQKHAYSLYLLSRQLTKAMPIGERMLPHLLQQKGTPKIVNYTISGHAENSPETISEMKPRQLITTES